MFCAPEGFVLLKVLSERPCGESPNTGLFEAKRHTSDLCSILDTGENPVVLQM